jgi:hypothetical protein
VAIMLWLRAATTAAWRPTGFWPKRRPPHRKVPQLKGAQRRWAIWAGEARRDRPDCPTDGTPFDGGRCRVVASGASRNPKPRCGCCSLTVVVLMLLHHRLLANGYLVVAPAYSKASDTYSKWLIQPAAVWPGYAAGCSLSIGAASRVQTVYCLRGRCGGDDIDRQGGLPNLDDGGF